MRTHTTLTLKNLIKDEMNAEMSLDAIERWKQALPAIYHEMIENIRFFTYSIFQKALVRRQVGQIHKEVIALLDSLDKLPAFNGELSVLKQRLSQCLEQLLDYLMEHCERYLDLDLNVPLSQVRICKANMVSHVEALEAKMKLMDVAVPLRKAVLAAFLDFQKRVRCSYKTLRYTQELLDSMRVCCAESTKVVVHAALARRLMSMDFNSEAFIQWYLGYIREGLSALYEPAEQRRYLEGYLWEFKRPAHRKYWRCFDPSRKRPHDLMDALLNVEMGKLPGIHPIPKSEPVVLATSTTAITSPYRIRTAFSVDALAYFIRLLVEAKVIESGIRTELLNFVSNSFTTPGTGSNGISATSLGSRYKQVVQTTALQVRAALMRMVGIIDAEFG